MSEEVALVLAVLMRKLRLSHMTISYEDLAASAGTRISAYVSEIDGCWRISAQPKQHVIESA